MKKYIGTKIIKAKRMTRKEYCDYRNWVIPADEDGKDEGYLVEYLNSPDKVHPNHENYISWSPESVFEEAYSLAENHIDRVIIERNDLHKKIESLETFVTHDRFNTRSDISSAEKHRMCNQLRRMKDYEELLNARIGATV